jgi:hypothetical protein
MNDKSPQVGDLVLGGRFVLLQQVKASLGSTPIYLGTKGVCRYCGTRNPSRFRELAHAFPESLGNKWIFSRDECDDCNDRFSVYEDALAKAVSPFLTLGGIKGKDNKVRQTGRSKGRAIMARREGGERPQVFMALNEVNWQDLVRIDPGSYRIQLTTLVAAVPFKPRHAYKALTKMAIALLPDDELTNYQKLRAWLLDIDDDVDFHQLEVAMSFASIGNAPPLMAGSLLRRANPADVVPHILFILTSGSLCLQIDLMSDHLEDHLPPIFPGAIRIRWSNIVGGAEGRKAINFQYSDPIHLNWSSRKSAAQPIESLVLDFDQATCEGRWTPNFRK